MCIATLLHLGIILKPIAIYGPTYAVNIGVCEWREWWLISESTFDGKQLQLWITTTNKAINKLGSKCNKNMKWNIRELYEKLRSDTRLVWYMWSGTHNFFFLFPISLSLSLSVHFSLFPLFFRQEFRLIMGKEI